MLASWKGHAAAVQALLADARVEVNLQDKVCALCSVFDSSSESVAVAVAVTICAFFGAM